MGFDWIFSLLFSLLCSTHRDSTINCVVARNVFKLKREKKRESENKPQKFNESEQSFVLHLFKPLYYTHCTWFMWVWYTHVSREWIEKNVWTKKKTRSYCTCVFCARIWAHVWQLYSHCLYKRVRAQHHFSFSLLCCPRNNRYAADIDRVVRKAREEKKRIKTNSVWPNESDCFQFDLVLFSVYVVPLFANFSQVEFEFANQKRKKKWCTHD